MMLARFVGGPLDGEMREIVGESMTFRAYEAPEPPWMGESSRTRPKIVEYHGTRWTRDGYRLFVVEGYDRSLIGDKEIEAAARWLAEQVAEAESPRDWSASGRIAYLTDQARAELRRWRDKPKPDNCLILARAVPPFLLFTVKVFPGLALGYQGHEREPYWRWPDRKEGDELIGRAIQKDIDRLAKG